MIKACDASEAWKPNLIFYYTGKCTSIGKHWLFYYSMFSAPDIIWAASWENRLFAYAKTKTQISFAETAKLINAFVFATRIVQSLFFLNPKYQASSYLLWLYSPVCVGPGRKPRRPVFSQRGSILVILQLLKGDPWMGPYQKCGNHAMTLLQLVFTFGIHPNVAK